MSTQRIQWLDAAKGLGILTVVLGHALRGLMDGNIATDPVWEDFDFVLYTFHMPLFMFLAGLNVPGSLRHGGGRYVRSKVLTVLWPYLVWSMIQGLILVLMARFVNSPSGWSSLAQILWKPISPFWFLYALFVFMMLARLLAPRPLLAISAVLFLCADMVPQSTLASDLLHFPLFFSLGVMVGSLDRSQVMRLSPSDAIAAFLVAAIAIGTAWAKGFTDHDSALMFPAALGGGLFVIWLAQRLEGVQWLGTIGRLSMAIYVMHILATAGTRIVLQKIVHLPPVTPIYLALGTACGVLLPVLAYTAMRSLNMLPWFGLAIGSRGRCWIETGKVEGMPAVTSR